MKEVVIMDKNKQYENAENNERINEGINEEEALKKEEPEELDELGDPEELEVLEEPVELEEDIAKPKKPEPAALKEENPDRVRETLHMEKVDEEEEETAQRTPAEPQAKGVSGGRLFTLLVVAVMVGSLLSFSLFYAALPALLRSRGLAGSADWQQVVINPTSDLTVFSAVAEKAMPSVVGITTVQITQGVFSGNQRSQGVGTGVIVDARGYILTNSHVINDGQADEVTVILHDGSHHTAQVLWFEQIMDLAVIKIHSGVNLIPAELGDSDALIVGEIVVAIGNPLGLNFERTLTQGVVSGLNRSIRISANQVIDNLIQTDASINPGNSGGPLLNTRGQVIGINTAKMTSGEGLGFSIPINTAKPIVDQFIERGEFRRVYLGIRGFNARDVESATGTPRNAGKGVFVVEVMPGSAAESANLQPEDIIIALNGVEVATMGNLIRELYKFRPGDQATVTYMRGHEVFTVEVTLSE